MSTAEKPILTSFDVVAARYGATGDRSSWVPFVPRPMAAPAAEASQTPPVPEPRPWERRTPEPFPRTRRTVEQGPLAGFGFTVRAVLQLAPDLDIPTPDLVYTALWAPVVEADMQARDAQAAFLSRRRLAEATGMEGTKLMAPGGVVERAAHTVGIVQMVTRGVPGAVPAEDGEGWRGEATSWTVTRPLDGFTHTPARTGDTPRVATDGRALHDAEIDPAAVAVWLHPLHPWWGPKTAGATGMRAVAALITRYGWVDLLLSATDVAQILGAHRQTAWRVLTALADLGLAQREGKRGRWRVRLASHLGRLTADDVKYDQRRPTPPSAKRARLHDWGWFSREGRGVRTRACSIAAERTPGWDFPGDELRLDHRTGRPWGILIWTMEQLCEFARRGEAAARALLGAAVERAALKTHHPPVAPQERSTADSGATAAPPVPAVTPDPVVPEPEAPAAAAPVDDGPMFDGFPVDEFGCLDLGRATNAVKIRFLQRHPFADVRRPIPGWKPPGEDSSSAPQGAAEAPRAVPGPPAGATLRGSLRSRWGDSL